MHESGHVLNILSSPSFSKISLLQSRLQAIRSRIEQLELEKTTAAVKTEQRMTTEMIKAEVSYL